MGEPSGLEIDHINRNGLDNRRSNLRIATRSQQRANQLKRTHHTTYKGIFAWGNKWAARISYDNKKYHLGVFDFQEDAAKAYDEAARRLHGQFARLNFPLPGEHSALHE